MSVELIQPGDEVTIHIPDENWEWGYHPVEQQNGVKAIVMGYTEHIWSRVSGLKNKPGVYENTCWIKVKTEYGKEYVEFSGRLKLIDREEHDRRIELIKGVGTPGGKFIRDLPETKFWEGDKVKIKGKECKIVGIEYNWKKKGESMPYNYTDDGCGFMTEREHNIELIERGNVWKYYHDDKIEFKDIYEEGEFYKMIGRTDYVRNPVNGLYKWTKEEALQGIKDGIIDCITLSRGLGLGLDTKIRVEPIRYMDRDIGERIRTASIKGFEVE